VGKAVLILPSAANDGLDGVFCTTVDGWKAGAASEGFCLLEGSRDGYALILKSGVIDLEASPACEDTTLCVRLGLFVE